MSLSLDNDLDMLGMEDDGPEQPERPTRYAIIVSHSVSAADVYARERKWERIGTSKWRTPSGETVVYVGTAEGLLGRGQGTRVFLGYAWYERIPDLLDECQARDYMIVESGYTDTC